MQELTYCLSKASKQPWILPGKNILVLTSNVYHVICKHTLIKYSLKCVYSGIKTTQLVTFWSCKVLSRSIIRKATSSSAFFHCLYNLGPVSLEPTSGLTVTRTWSLARSGSQLSAVLAPRDCAPAALFPMAAYRVWLKLHSEHSLTCLVL